jgi:hypothetical protein
MTWGLSNTIFVSASGKCFMVDDMKGPHISIETSVMEESCSPERAL